MPLSSSGLTLDVMVRLSFLTSGHNRLQWSLQGWHCHLNKITTDQEKNRWERKAELRTGNLRGEPANGILISQKISHVSNIEWLEM